MKRIIMIILAVAIAIAAAVVPVSAVIDAEFYEQFTYIATDNTGCIYLSKCPLIFVPSTSETGRNGTKAVSISIIPNTSDSTLKDIIVLYPINTEYLPYPEVIQYEAKLISRDTHYHFEPSNNYWYQQTNNSYYYTFDYFELTYQLPNKGVLHLRVQDTNNLYSYTVTSNYAALNHFNNYPYVEYLRLPLENFNTDYSLTLEKIIGVAGEEDQIFIDKLYEAIKKALDDQTSDIINIGNQYIQFLPTDKAAALEQTQNQLSQSENAVKDKSESLTQKVSNQWSNNVSITKNFVNTVTPATAAVTTTISNIVAVMPDEVQTLLVVVPMIIFIGWLIGRIGGDR